MWTLILEINKYQNCIQFSKIYSFEIIFLPSITSQAKRSSNVFQNKTNEINTDRKVVYISDSTLL